MGRWVISKGRRIYIPDEGEENPFAKKEKGKEEKKEGKKKSGYKSKLDEVMKEKQIDDNKKQADERNREKGKKSSKETSITKPSEQSPFIEKRGDTEYKAYVQKDKSGNPQYTAEVRKNGEKIYSRTSRHWGDTQYRLQQRMKRNFDLENMSGAKIVKMLTSSDYDLLSPKEIKLAENILPSKGYKYEDGKWKKKKSSRGDIWSFGGHPG